MADAAHRAAIVLLCVFFGWKSLRLALGITPESAEYHFRQGSIDCALALNPRYTAAWIARGLEAEARGHRREAEASLLRAAQVDQTYLPRWTLANFYLRSGDRTRFWIWARRTAEIAHDPAPLFQLCWRASDDAGEILERAIPSRPVVRRAYLNFLMRTSRLHAAEPLAREVSQSAGPSDLDLLLRYCDATLADKQVRQALDIWNALAGRHLIPYGDLVTLTNGDFSAAPLGHGFDWRVARVEGASVGFDSGSRAMSVVLSGKQPESCDLVEQYAPVEPDAKYIFRFLNSAREPVAGLSWSLIDAVTGDELGTVAVSSGAGQTIRLSTSRNCELARLVLRYRRPRGSVRTEGAAVFHRLTLEQVN